MTVISSLRMGLAAMVAASLLVPGAANAQADENARIVTIMRACAQIEDIAARVACYDNNILPRDGGAPASPPLPPRASRDDAPPPQGFGSEEIPRQQASQRPAGAGEIEARVSASERLGPGIYLVTLADGAQWRFVDAASMTYKEPQAGDTIRLERGALGSVYLRFDGQRGIRVTRVR